MKSARRQLLVRIACVVLGFCIQSSRGESNLVNNGDFEWNNHASYWYCNQCTMSPSTDRWTGSYSIRIHNRQDYWANPAQTISGMRAGHMYKVSMHVKLLSAANNAPYQRFDVIVLCKDYAGQDHYVHFGSDERVKPRQWREIGGVDFIPNGYHDCSVYPQTEFTSEYLVDHVTVVGLPVNNAWKANAQTRIDNIRKADVQIQFTGSSDPDNTVDIELKQNKMEFAFGTAVDASKVVDSTTSSRLYRDALFKDFEWAVLENALKWTATEPHMGRENYSLPLTAMQVLSAHGMKMRCQNVFWDKGQYVNYWLKSLSRTQLRALVNHRIQSVIEHTHGLCEHWEVNGEMLHDDFWEKHTGDGDVTVAMFRQVRAYDNKPLLFLNDYNILPSTETTMAQKSLAVEYKNSGVPIGGIGAEGQFHDVNVHTLKARLDILAEAGLPVVITGFTITDVNDHRKAQRLEDSLTMMFSHPAVHGVIFWGFWDGAIYIKDNSLYRGSTIQPNAAGLVYQRLFHNDWRTHVTKTHTGSHPYHVRAFKGEYTLTVKQDGEVIHTENFTLTDSGKSVSVKIPERETSVFTIVG